MSRWGHAAAAILFAFIAVVAAVMLAYAPVGVKASQPADCMVAGVADPTTNFSERSGSKACEQRIRTVQSEDVTLRFTLEQSDSTEPVRFLRTRIGPFHELALTVVDKDGASRTRRYTPETVGLTSGEPFLLVELPEVTPQSTHVFAQLTGARHDATILRAELFSKDPSTDPAQIQTLIIIAILMGMMILPIVFDLAFFIVLRSNFLLWHGALSLSFAFLVLTRSGLIVEMAEVSMETWRILLIGGLGLSTFLGAKFSMAFIEEGRLHPRLRSGLGVAGYWSIAVSAIHLMDFEILQALGGTFHSYAMMPVTIVFTLAYWDAFRRGSQSVRFQILGWIPLLFSFALQLTSNLLPNSIPTDALPVFYLGVLSQCTITAMGVADRFMDVRSERDDAVSEAKMLEKLSERDPLTGLLNRRAIDARFEALHKEGYDTFALIDLDHFKSINDTEGHQAGDDVLKVVAHTIAEDERNMAIRMGGEEFLVLLRGKSSMERAEKLRQAIPLRVAQQMPQLEQLVTASMGVLAAPRDAMPSAHFSDVYSRADMLLYAAKGSGRNRTVKEKLQVFKAGSERRKGRERRKAGGHDRRRTERAA